MTASNYALELIAQNILLEQRKTISGVVGTGRLLADALDQCEHGEFMKWAAKNCPWSHATTLRYRRAFEFANTIDDFGNLNLTIMALYFVAELALPGSLDTALARSTAVKAIVRTARKRLVTEDVAEAIYEKIKNPHPIDPVEDETPPPPPVPGPAEPARHTGEQVELFPDDDDTGGDAVVGDPVPENQILAAMLRAILQRYPADSREWPVAINDIGQVEYRRFADLVSVGVSNHCDGGALKSKADRAEAKSKNRKGVA
jgi:hypothetical protein